MFVLTVEWKSRPPVAAWGQLREAGSCRPLAPVRGTAGRPPGRAPPCGLEPHLPRRRRDAKVTRTVTAESVLDGPFCRTLLKLTRADGGPRRVVSPLNF